MSARSIVAFGVIALVACQEEPSAQREPFTREQLLDPETCKECHINHYNQWSSSMHAYASRDPVFRAMNKRGQEEAELGEFCVQCHAPMAVRENAISDFSDLSAIPDHLQGVTCYFCHNAVAVGEPHNNARITLANDTTMRGALNNPLDPKVHGVATTRSPLHDRASAESALMCGTCHDIVTPPPDNTHLERTLAEWQESVQASSDPAVFQSCQECHMDEELLARPAAPGFAGVTARINHSHMFPAVDVALTPDLPFQDAMRSAVERCELQQRSVTYVDVREGSGDFPWTPGEPYRFTVLLETQAGHSQPSGAANDRRMWLEVVAITGDQEIWWSGRIQDDEPEEPAEPIASQGDQLCMFRARFLKANGDPAHMFWDAVGESIGQVLPTPKSNVPGSHTEDCPYTINTPPFDAPEKLRIRLRMRPMGFDVLQDLVDSGHLDPSIIGKMPTFTMYEREDTFDPESRVWRRGQPLESDCNEYKCLMDPMSPDCLATQGQ